MIHFRYLDYFVQNIVNYLNPILSNYSIFIEFITWHWLKIKTQSFSSWKKIGIEPSGVGGNGTGGGGDLVSPNSLSHHVRRPSKASSLAEDILAIRAALDGASASARERTLKTLERLTERLALAESERDMALGKSGLNFFLIKKSQYEKTTHVNKFPLQQLLTTYF